MAEPKTLDSLNNRSGIYKITNTINNKYYIGSAINFKRRCIQHKSKLKTKTHHSIKLQNAYNKYGDDVFIYEIIEECEKEILIKQEQYYIDTLKPYYNINKIAGSSLGRKTSDETKEKLRKINIGKTLSIEHKLKISESNKGKKRSDETKNNMSISQKLSLYRVGRKTSDETKLKISKSNKGKKRSDETKERISIAKQNISEETRKRMSEAQIGRKVSDEGRKNMSNAAKLRYKK